MPAIYLRIAQQYLLSLRHKRINKLLQLHRICHDLHLLPAPLLPFAASEWKLHNQLRRHCIPPSGRGQYGMLDKLSQQHDSAR